MKTEKLNALKEEVEALRKKLAELSEEELKLVVGGTAPELPATTLDTSGFSGMFAPCEPIVPVGSLPATIITPPEPGIT